MTSLAASEIIKKAYQDAQKIARFTALTTDQETDGLDRLNDIINLWQTQGLKLFLETETDVTLVAGVQKYPCGPGQLVNINRPLEVKRAAYWDADNNNRPLIALSRQEWTDLSSRTTQGSINQYFFEPLFNVCNLYFWQIPDTQAATGVVKVVFRNQASNPLVVGDHALFPPEWAIALRWALADEIATGMPDSVQQRCAVRAQVYKEALEAWDVENDVELRFAPDMRTANMGISRFR